MRGTDADRWMRGYRRSMETSVGSRPVGRRVLIAVGLGFALAAMWGAAAPGAEAVNGLTVFPRVGGIHATFALRFVAPFETYAGRVEAYYLFEADSAPKACEVYGETTDLYTFLRPGDRASILLPPPERDVGPDRWCPGRYVGHLSYDKYRATTGVLISSRRLASGIVLRVMRRDTPAGRRRPGLTFFPSLGGLRETFIASFVARYRTLTLSVRTGVKATTTSWREAPKDAGRSTHTPAISPCGATACSSALTLMPSTPRRITTVDAGARAGTSAESSTSETTARAAQCSAAASPPTSSSRCSR